MRAFEFTDKDLAEIVESETTISKEDVDNLIEDVRSMPTPVTNFTVEVGGDEEFMLETVAEHKGIEQEAALVMAMRMGLAALYEQWQVENGI